MKQKKRASGTLLHISSLPSPFGIGTFGKEAFAFVDFLAEAKQKYWQILPVGPTSYGDSPYSSFSTFAGNPYFIDLDLLCAEKLLKKSEYASLDWGSDPERTDFEKLFAHRYKVLRKAFQRDQSDLSAFTKENADWLPDFSLYMALKFECNLRSWMEWPELLKRRDPNTLERYRKKLANEIRFFVWQQYKFFEQWNALKSYANAQGVRIIGDLPIYVAGDSADTWSHPELFLFDEQLNPIEVAGCPPDAFAATGQLWGNPIYHWEAHQASDYDWWTRRMRSAFTLYDVVRIDHFRGFESFYAIPYGDPTAEFGVWRQGPGIDLFRHFKQALGKLDIIAEDLGYLTPAVRRLLKQSGYPGMKVLQFAFDSREESDYLPHNYQHNCVVYTGTHDNDTLCGWFQSAPRADVRFSKRYFHLSRSEGYHWGFIRHAYMSVADLAIIPMQDFLAQGSEARMNTPSTIGDNWQYRMKPGADTPELAAKIAVLVQMYSRA